MLPDEAPAMHEMALAAEVVDLVAATAGREGGRRVRLVVLEIGALAAVEAEALAFCFDAAARGTAVAGARLEIVGQPGAGRCRLCGAAAAMAERWDACPDCGGPLQPTAGTGMRVIEIEID